MRRKRWHWSGLVLLVVLGLRVARNLGVLRPDVMLPHVVLTAMAARPAPPLEARLELATAALPAPPQDPQGTQLSLSRDEAASQLESARAAYPNLEAVDQTLRPSVGDSPSDFPSKEGHRFAVSVAAPKDLDSTKTVCVTESSRALLLTGCVSQPGPLGH